MYELIILGLLMRRPMHGYSMGKIVNDIIGPFARLSNGRLYPLLAKLQASGLIASAGSCADRPDDRRPHHTFRITEDGQRRLHELLMDTTSYPGEYQKIFWQKLAFFDRLDRGERLFLVDHYLNYCQAHVFHLTSEMEDLQCHAVQNYALDPEQLAATLHVLGHALAQWKVDLADAQAWRDREVALSQAPAILESANEG